MARFFAFSTLFHLSLTFFFDRRFPLRLIDGFTKWFIHFHHKKMNVTDEDTLV